MIEAGARTGSATAGCPPEGEGGEATTGRTLAFVIFLLLTAFAAAAQGVPMQLDDALGIFQGDRVVVGYTAEGRAQLEAAIEVLKSALGVPAGLDETREPEVNSLPVAPEARDLTVKLSQGYFTLGVIFASGEDSEASLYLRGKHWGLKSLRMDPEFAAVEKRDGFLAAVEQETDAPSLYWACMNWLSVANFDPVTSVFSGVVKKTVTMLERILELDEAYDSYGAYRILGSVWGALPRLPFSYYRKDLERARTYLCHVVDDPELCGDLPAWPVDSACAKYLGNRRVLAQYYLMEKGLWAESAQVLQSVIDAPIGETYVLFNARAQDDARRLLGEVGKHL